MKNRLDGSVIEIIEDAIDNVNINPKWLKTFKQIGDICSYNIKEYKREACHTIINNLEEVGITELFYEEMYDIFSKFNDDYREIEEFENKVNDYLWNKIEKLDKELNDDITIK